MIEANGVLFPDIPEDILAEYPFAVISEMTVNGTQGARYMLGVSTSEYARIPKGVMPSPYGELEWLATATMSKAALNYSDTATVWGNWTDHPAGSGLYVYGEYEDEGQTIKESLIWANHDVYNATSVDMSTGSYTLGDIYFPKSEEKPSATRYSIGKAILDAVAKQIMRLTDSTAKVKPEEFADKLASVPKSGELPEGMMGVSVGRATTTLSGLAFRTSASGELKQ